MWGIWAIIALVLLIVEMFTVDFTFLMLAGGAFGAMFTAIFTDSWIAQIVVFAVISVVLLVFVRPWVRKHVNSSSTKKSNVYAYVGKTARTLTDVTETTGRAKVSGEVWSAKTDSGILPQGIEVKIVGIDGVHLVLEAPAVGIPEAEAPDSGIAPERA
ncbi:MAG: NfeD family protein [Actinomycetaceae bacterium]|nr:NfeD family protein [Arcanobacterium sp.]MDD7686391.1 NfeD family protein [Actinomycetaceae bacterium]MDY5272671.1 NfeD family protein [Arcanobacterium sp.]